MEEEARDLLARSGASVADVKLERTVDMRYAGQGYTVPVVIPDGYLGPELEMPLRDAFNRAYERRFGSHLKTADAEALHWRLTARVPVASGELTFQHTAGGEAKKGERRAYFSEVGDFVNADVLDRYALEQHVPFSGPVLIEERESTVVVGPAGTVEADELGNLLITIDVGPG
jgi:N-methylhydantoinase A